MNNLICVLIASIFTLSACGGGGSGGGTTPTDPNKSFSLASIQSTAIGTVYFEPLTGSDSDGAAVTGSISVANRAQMTLNGVLVIPQDVLFTFTIGGVNTTSTATSFLDSFGNLISFTVQPSGVSCTPASPDSLPPSIKIGDFGIRSILVCDDNTTANGSWRAEDGGNGLIKYIVNSTIKDQFNVVVSVSDFTFTLDENGDIVTLKLVVTVNAFNYTVTLQST